MSTEKTEKTEKATVEQETRTPLLQIAAMGTIHDDEDYLDIAGHHVAARPFTLAELDVALSQREGTLRDEMDNLAPFLAKRAMHGSKKLTAKFLYENITRVEWQTIINHYMGASTLKALAEAAEAGK